MLKNKQLTVFNFEWNRSRPSYRSFSQYGRARWLAMGHFLLLFGTGILNMDSFFAHLHLPHLESSIISSFLDCYPVRNPAHLWHSSFRLHRSAQFKSGRRHHAHQLLLSGARRTQYAFAQSIHQSALFKTDSRHVGYSRTTERTYFVGCSGLDYFKLERGLDSAVCSSFRFFCVVGELRGTYFAHWYKSKLLEIRWFVWFQ